MTTSNLIPKWASPPGETIVEVLKQRDLDPADFASQLGATTGSLAELLLGSSKLDRALAEKLSTHLGSTPGFWLRREEQYRADVARFDSLLDPGEAQLWLRELPVAEMARLGWIGRRTRRTEKAGECLRFFGYCSIQEWRKAQEDTLQGVSFKTSQTFRSEPGAVAAWLRRGELLAARESFRPWRPEALAQSIEEIRSLTRLKNFDTAPRRLHEHCRNFGLSVLMIPTPAGCRASGAARVLRNGHRVIQLSGRYRSDDHFWFTFFHEVGHLLLHSNQALFLEEEEAGPFEDVLEREADQFSENTLIPPPFRREFLSLPKDHRKIIRFARKVGIARGIVVGQLQHAGRIPHGHFNQLKKRFSEDQSLA